jgi:hypothetical protein
MQPKHDNGNKNSDPVVVPCSLSLWITEEEDDEQMKGQIEGNGRPDNKQVGGHGRLAQTAGPGFSKGACPHLAAMPPWTNLSRRTQQIEAVEGMGVQETGRQRRAAGT